MPWLHGYTVTGHILPADQPRVSRDMVERFVFGQPFPTLVAAHAHREL